MRRRMMKSKIHRATVTDADLALRRLDHRRPRPDGRRRPARVRAGRRRRHRQRRPPRDLRHRGRAGLGRDLPQRRRRPPGPPGRPGHPHQLLRGRRCRPGGRLEAHGRPRRHRQPPDQRGAGQAARRRAPLRRGRRQATDEPTAWPELPGEPTNRSTCSSSAPASPGCRPRCGPPRRGMRVGVLTKAALDMATTRWAQGGVAAVLGGADPDSTDLHLADTLAAGDGLCDVDAVRVLVDEGPDRVHELIALGAVFDVDDRSGELARAREGGHSVARIVHAGGAATGMEIERALVAAVRETATTRPRAHLRPRPHRRGRALPRACTALAADGSADRGAQPPRPGRHRRRRPALRRHHQPGRGHRRRHGDGAAGRRGGAPTSSSCSSTPPRCTTRPCPARLLSEALRGHGALLRDTNGERFVDELLPRDKVSRAITERMHDLGADHVFLDATGLDDFAVRFPTIAAALAEVGLDPATDWLPVAPAAHYCCGGVVADLDGATSLPGLWAAGEVACNGVMGANRLASNSLLDGMVFAPRAVDAIDAGVDGPDAHRRHAGRASALDDVPDGVIGGRRLDAPPTSTRRRPHHPGRAAGRHDRARRACCARPSRSPMAADSSRRARRRRRASPPTRSPTSRRRPGGRAPAPSLARRPAAPTPAWSSRPATRASPCASCSAAEASGRPWMAAAHHDPPITEVRRVGRVALAEDLMPLGDLTAALLPDGVDGDGRLRAPGAGRPRRHALRHRGLRPARPGGRRRVARRRRRRRRRPAASVGTVSGPLASILTGERTALNFLNHLSGVATSPSRFVEAAAAGGGRPACGTRARPRPGCARSRRRRCGPVAAGTTGATSRTG